VRIPIRRRRRSGACRLRLLDLNPVGDELPAHHAEEVAEALRASTAARVLVRHDRHTHRARVYTDASGDPPDSAA
jgi:hypothetical protein